MRARVERPPPVRHVAPELLGKSKAGEHTIHFKYSPMSFKLGLFISFMAWMIVVFLLAIWLWRLAYREEKHAATTTQRVAKNSLAPMALNLFNRVIDFAFAALMLRILQPENAGNYYFAVVIVGWLEIFTNFGLNTFLTREVSRDRSGANRFFANTSILRLILGGIALVIVAVVPFALFASIGRGYLLPIGVAILALIMANLVVVAGWGEYFPWAIPALFAGAAGPRSGQLGPHSYLIVPLASLVGIAATLAWWRSADQTR